jgi:RNA polymerase primary sigma factor
VEHLTERELFTELRTPGCTHDRAEAIKAVVFERHRNRLEAMAARFTRGRRDPAWDDFVQAGSVGVWLAMRTYDPEGGQAFSTWAYRSVRREMVRHMKRTEYGHLPQRVFEARQQVLRMHREGLPTAEIADATGLTDEQVDLVISEVRVVSLEEATGHDRTITDLLADDADQYADLHRSMEHAEMVKEGLRNLSELEAWVLIRRYGLDGTAPQGFGEIGDELGVSRERARAVHAAAMERMRQHLPRAA